MRWGEAPQREYTVRRLCPGPHGSDAHMSEWWRWVNPPDRDGWHCCACGWNPPEVSPIDGTTVEHPDSTIRPVRRAIVFTLDEPIALAA